MKNKKDTTKNQFIQMLETHVGLFSMKTKLLYSVDGTTTGMMICGA